ncbi:hypothetical protein [Nocardia fluminea]|uniref:hypothetical protein n=1 Tax=Nocardia fluminea TaxID=134984 RepID=UPI003D12B4DA
MKNLRPQHIANGEPIERIEHQFDKTDGGRNAISSDHGIDKDQLMRFIATVLGPREPTGAVGGAA